MIDLRNIKNIIFDLGGVILNIDYQLTIDAFKKLSLNNFDQFYSQFTQNDLLIAMEKGEITPQEFRIQLRKYISKPVSDIMIDNAWNAMLLDFPPERIVLLQMLKNKYRTFLLSNTNSIHLDFYSNLLNQKFDLQNLSHLFEKEYYSHELKMKKPDSEIFEYVLRENDLIPSETLFIDDTSIHVESAIKLGINGYLLKKGESITDIL